MGFAMPELPEVETTVRGLHALMRGRNIKKVNIYRDKLRFLLPANLARAAQNARVLSVTRRAKYILINLDNARTVLVHLGMSGRLTKVSAGASRDKHDHVVITLDNDTQLAFNDPRRFGMIDITATATQHNHKMLRTLGPEPLGKDLTPDTLAKRLRGKKAAIKALLLDQRIIAGLGNIYVSEALFWSGIRPTRKGGALSLAEIKKLVPAIRKVLNAAIKAGGTSMRNYVQADGKLGFFQDRFAVYDRAGQPCPGCTCKGKNPIKRLVQGGRATYFCPTKQR